MENNQFVASLLDGFAVMRAHGFRLMREGGGDIKQDALAVAKIILGGVASEEPTKAALALAKTLAENAHRTEISGGIAASSRDPSSDTDILDREGRIFASLQAVIDLMESSHSQEVREAQSSISFLFDEYKICRQALIA